MTIVDVYDAITSPRIYRPTSISPDNALGIILADSGKHFDPVLLKIFINMLGVYPVGTLLKLDTGEIELVLHSAQKADPSRPHVQLLDPDPDQKYAKGKLIDLAERDPQTGQYLRNILKSEHPATIGIQPARFFV